MYCEKDRGKVLTPEIDYEIDRGKVPIPRKDLQNKLDKVLGTELGFLENSRKMGQKDEEKKQKTS